MTGNGWPEAAAPKAQHFQPLKHRALARSAQSALDDAARWRRRCARSASSAYSDLNKAATRRLGLMLAEMLRAPVRGAASQDGAASGATLGS